MGTYISAIRTKTHRAVAPGGVKMDINPVTFLHRGGFDGPGRMMKMQLGKLESVWAKRAAPAYVCVGDPKEHPNAFLPVYTGWEQGRTTYSDGSIDEGLLLIGFIKGAVFEPWWSMVVPRAAYMVQEQLVRDLASSHAIDYNTPTFLAKFNPRLLPAGIKRRRELRGQWNSDLEEVMLLHGRDDSLRVGMKLLFGEVELLPERAAEAA